MTSKREQVIQAVFALIKTALPLADVQRNRDKAQTPGAHGDVILRDGDPGDFFCVLAEGELKVTKNGRILNLLTPGDCFGEMAVISKVQQTRGADVVALTESKIVTVKGEALKKASEACRMHFYQSFLEVLTSRLALANARLAAF